MSWTRNGLGPTRNCSDWNTMGLASRTPGTARMTR